MIEARARSRPKPFMKRFVEVFDPLMAFTGLIANIYVEITLLCNCGHKLIISTAVIGMVASIFIYLSVIQSYKVLRIFFRKHEVIGRLLGCNLGKLLKKYNCNYKFRYVVFISGIAISILITALSALVLAEMKQ